MGFVHVLSVVMFEDSFAVELVESLEHLLESCFDAGVVREAEDGVREADRGSVADPVLESLVVPIHKV